MSLKLTEMQMVLMEIKGNLSKVTKKFQIIQPLSNHTATFRNTTNASIVRYTKL